MRESEMKCLHSDLFGKIGMDGITPVRTPEHLFVKLSALDASEKLDVH